MPEIYDDFLSKEQWEPIRDLICGDNFPWYWTEHVLNEDREDEHPILCDPMNNFQFFHEMYHHNLSTSNQLFNLSPILDGLNLRSLVRVKANLNVRTEEIVRHGFHTDFDYDGCTTSIFYCNTNDGYTEFEDGTKVESVENRLITFPTQMMHSGTTCTNSKSRIIININYF